MAPHAAALPAGFCAAPPPPPLLTAAVAAAPSVWLVQLPAGFDARRLVGSKLRCSENGGGRLTLDGARLRIDAEEDRVAAQLFVSAPCGGKHGARLLRAEQTYVSEEPVCAQCVVCVGESRCRCSLTLMLEPVTPQQRRCLPVVTLQRRPGLTAQTPLFKACKRVTVQTVCLSAAWQKSRRAR